MRKIMILIGIIILSNSATKAQEVISPAGDYFENHTGSLSWTLGEISIETFTAGETILTQGFQQPEIMVGTFYENIGANFQMTIFPNPTKAFLTVYTDFEQAQNLEYRIFDMMGRLIASNRLVGEHTRIAFNDYHPGYYFLSIHTDELLLKVFKIIKQ